MNESIVRARVDRASMFDVMTTRCPRPRATSRRWSVLLVAGLIACACGAVMAGERRPGGGARPPAMRAGAFAQQQRAAAARQERAQAAQRAVQPQPQTAPADRPPEPPAADRTGKPGKLTPDERRALRQQINDAGRDIYRVPRP